MPFDRAISKSQSARARSICCKKILGLDFNFRRLASAMAVRILNGNSFWHARMLSFFCVPVAVKSTVRKLSSRKSLLFVLELL